MLQYSRLNHSSKTGSTILKPSPDFSMKSLSTRVFLFLVMVRGAPSPYSATTCWALNESLPCRRHAGMLSERQAYHQYR